MSESRRTESHSQNQKAARTNSENIAESESKNQKATQTKSENMSENIRKMGVTTLTTPLFWPQTER